MADKDFLADSRDEFDLCVEHENDNRKESLDDLRFARLAEQWPEKIRKQREDDHRPILTINRLPASIRQVVNDARQNKPSIVVHPVDSGADPKTAELISGLIRNIESQSSADVAYDTALDFAVTMGFGYWRINTEYAADDTFDLDIRIKQIANPFSVYGDPYKDEPDSANWDLAFVVDRLAKKQFEKQYRGADAVNWDDAPYDGLGAPWLDGDMVQVAERWGREEVEAQLVQLSTGEVLLEEDYKANKALFDAIGASVIASRPVKSYLVTQVIMSGAEVLERRKWAGKYIPIVPVYGEDVNVEGKRYLRSMVRDAKDPQRMFNFWRTASTELVALAPKAPFVGPKGAFKTDTAKWRTANTASHAYLEYDGQVPPQRQPFAGVPAGAVQEALNASDDMKAVMGMFDASLGAQGNETSGRAILARQKEGDVGSFHFIDNQARAIKHTGRIILDLIPKIYDVARIVRVLGLDGEAQTAAINQPTTIQAKGPDGQAQEIAHVYDLTAGKYDLVVDVGPSYTTQRQESASQMIELIRAYPDAAPIIGDLLAKNLDWPGADEIADRLKQAMAAKLGQQSGAPGLPPEVGQKMQELAQQLQAAQAENASLKQDRSIDEQKNEIDSFDAQTKRIKVIADANKPSHLPR